VKGAYFLKYMAVHIGLRALTARKKHCTGHSELLIVMELTKPQALQGNLEVAGKVPYRPEFWNTYQVLLPAEGKITNPLWQLVSPSARKCLRVHAA
jgi:hypothetical protein